MPKQESLPSPPLTDKAAEKQRKKKSKESKSRDRKKSGSKESETTTTANHHHKSNRTVEPSDADDLQEAGRALESKLIEDSLIAIAHLAQKDKKEAELRALSVVDQHQKKKKKKSRKAHRDEPPPAIIKTEPGLELTTTTVMTGLVIKTEPSDICPSAPIASSSPRVKHVAADVVQAPEVEPKLSMPSLSWEPSTSPVPPTPTAAASVTTPEVVAEPAARPGIWKQETEDAVAGLLTETFDDFKEEILDQEPEEQVETPDRSALIQQQWPPEQEESPQPNEEAQKAIQSLQCEDDLDMSDEMIIDETGASSTEDTAGPTECPPYSGSSSSDVVEMESRAARLAATSSKPAAVETAPTPPPSPPELCIDETRCQPESSPRKDREMPRTPDIDLSSKSPRTPRTPDVDLLDRSSSSVRPTTPDIHPLNHPPMPVSSIKSEPVAAQSPPKRTNKKPPPTPPTRGAPRRVRGRPSGSSRGVSESSVEGHDADVYEFFDNEEEQQPTPVPTAPPAVAPPVVPLEPVVEVKTEDLKPSTVESMLPDMSISLQQRNNLEGLKGRLIDPRTTIDDTIENVVRGHHALVAMNLVAAPSSPRIQSPRAYTPHRASTETSGPAVMKVELPQPLKETTTPLVDPVTGHLTPIRRPDHDPAQHAAGVVVRRAEEAAAPSTVVLNLRSGPSQAVHPATPVSNPLAKVPSPNLGAAISTGLPTVSVASLPTSGVHSSIVTSSVTIIPTATSTASNPMPSTTATEVARLPSATVVTPVPARPAASSGSTFPAVPLTRDTPAHGLLLQQQQQQQQQQMQQSIPVPAVQAQSIKIEQQQPIAAPQQPPQQQLPSHPPQLQLPAGVPGSLSGGATVIAVASSGRSGSTPLLGRSSSGNFIHFLIIIEVKYLII